MSEAQALRVHDLDVAYRVRRRDLAVLRQVDFTIARGEAYGLVGESGCGKSTVALAIVRYLSANGRVTGGRIEVAGRDVLAMDPAELRRMRATGVSMVYQDPGKALNPSLKVGSQLAEDFELTGVSRGEAQDRAVAMLKRVRIADPGAVMDRYPTSSRAGCSSGSALRQPWPAILRC